MKTQIKYELKFSFNQIKELALKLPEDQQVKLSRALRKKSWQKDFDQTRKLLSEEIKKSGYTLNDVPELIRQVRNEHAKA